MIILALAETTKGTGSLTISAVAHCPFHNTSGLVNSLDSNLKLVYVIQSVKDSEDVDWQKNNVSLISWNGRDVLTTMLLSLLNKVIDGVVG